MASYAEIVEIVAPSEAVAGSRVDITVRIKNLHTAEIAIMAGGALEYGVTPWPGITFPASWVAEFIIMPSASVKAHAYSYWYGGDGAWHFDDDKTRTVSLAQLSPDFSAFRITNYVKV